MGSFVHQETEQKFDGLLPQPLTPQGLAGVDRVVPGESGVLEARYYDSEDLALLNHGVTLRRREGGDDQGWHLKVPGPHGSRTEFQHPLTDGTATPPPELVRRARVYAKGAELHPVAHVRTYRTRTLLLDARGRTLAEVAADDVAARSLGPAVEAAAEAATAGTGEALTELRNWYETEVELADLAPAEGGADLLDSVAAVFAAQGVHPSQAPSKLARALGAEPSPALLPSDVSDYGPTVEGLVGALRRHTARLMQLDQAVRADEPDAVHQMRIATRRLRSLLKILGRLTGQRALTPPADELRWLGRLLGAHRDPQTLGERLAAQAEELPAAAHPAATAFLVRSWADEQCAAARLELLQVLDSARYFTLVDTLERTAAQPPLGPGRRYGRKAARRVLRRETRRVSRRAREAQQQPYGPDRDRALHSTRKAAKRARYGAEGLATALDRAGRRAKQFKKIQKRLGRHQDAVAAEQVLTELVHAPNASPTAAFSYGLLFARQRHGADADVSAALRASRKAARA